MEDNQVKILEVAIDRLNQEDIWFATKEDKMYANAKDLYKLDKYGELTDKAKERLVSEVEQYLGDGASFLIEAVDQWIEDNLIEGILGYVDNLHMDFEIPEVSEEVTAYSEKGVTDLGAEESEEADQLRDHTEKKTESKKLTEGVSWEYYNKFDDVNDKYFVPSGEGETLASQIVVAINQLIYKWYNDGDVYDNSSPCGLTGGANDMSSYANWLAKYVDGAKEILDTIFDLDYGDEGEYEKILRRLADEYLDLDFLKTAEVPKEGSIYNCDGPYKFEEMPEDEDLYESKKLTESEDSNIEQIAREISEEQPLKNNLYTRNWLSGSNTTVRPIEIDNNKIIYQLKYDRDVYSRFIQKIIDKYPEITDGHFSKSDGSCPSTLSFIYRLNKTESKTLTESNDEYEASKYKGKEWGVFAKKSRAWVCFGTEKEMKARAERLNSGKVEENKKVTEAYTYYWKDDIDEVDLESEANLDLLYAVAENMQETNEEYRDYDVYEIASDIICLWKIEKRSRLYDYLLKWYGSEDKLLANVRDVYDTNNAIYFVTGVGYSIFSADLLGGSADGLAERDFDNFVNNGGKREESKKITENYKLSDFSKIYDIIHILSAYVDEDGNPEFTERLINMDLKEAEIPAHVINSASDEPTVEYDGNDEEVQSVVDKLNSLNMDDLYDLLREWRNTHKEEFDESKKITEARDINNLKSELETKIRKVMTSAEFGFEENDVDDYFTVEVSKAGVDGVKVEVRAEVSYEGLEKLAEALNPVAAKYDIEKVAYFDAEQPGILVTYITADSKNLNESKKVVESKGDLEAYKSYILDNMLVDAKTGKTDKEIILDNIHTLSVDVAESVVADIYEDIENMDDLTYYKILNDYSDDIREVIQNNVDEIVKAYNDEYDAFEDKISKWK